MTKITDAEVDAACEAFVGQWDEVAAFLDWPSLRADMRSALEAAEAVRVKAESNLQKVQIPTSTIPEGFIPWHGGECPVAEETAVDYVMRDGYVIRESRAKNLRWKHINADCDIIAYRIRKPADPDILALSSNQGNNHD
jgi:hypothetical protein